MTNYDIRIYGNFHKGAVTPVYWTVKFQHILDDLTFDQVKKLYLVQNPHLDGDLIAVYNTSTLRYCN